MKDSSYEKLANAELFYKWSLAISSSLLNSEIDLEYIEYFAWGRHCADKDDLQLTKGQEILGATLQEFIGTYMMILQLNKILEDEWGTNRLQHKSELIRSISQVVRLIRNAFAHDPMSPKWDISPSAKDKIFEIPDILSLDTHNLHSKKLSSSHYGGPIALLRLLQIVMKTHDSKTNQTTDPLFT